MTSITAVVVGAPRRLLRSPGAKSKVICRFIMTEGRQVGRDRHEKSERRCIRARNPRRQHRTDCLKNVEQGEESPASPIRRTEPPTDSSNSNYVEAMLVSYVVASVKSEEFDLDDTASMDSTPFCPVCLNDNHKTSECQQIQSLASFTPTRNRNLQQCRTHNNWRSIEHPKPRGAEQPRRPDWKHHSRERRNN